MLIAFTSVPGFVTLVWRGMPTVWRGRHRRICCGLSCMPAVSPGRKTLEAMARWTPATLTAWRFGRWRKAASWPVPLLVRWLAPELVATWPAPANGLLSRCGDGRHADQRGPTPPVGQHGRLRQQHPWFLGRRCVLLRAAWDGERVPGGLRRILPPRQTPARSANVWWRARVRAWVPPSWATLVSVGGEAAYGAKAKMDRGKARDQADTTRRWGLVLARARPGKTVEDQSLKHLVPHVPHKSDPGPRVPRAHGRKGRKTLWTSRTRLCLRHVGDVTGGLRKHGRNMGPQPPPILGTNLAALPPSQVVCIAPKRWAIAIMHWERKAGLGLGEPQVRGDPNRREQAVGIAVLASLWVLRGCHHEMVPGNPWSLFQLQHALRLRVMTNQVEHTVKVRMAKTRKAA